MTNDKTQKDQQSQERQTTQDGATPVNPFRDAEDTASKQLTPEQEADLEQQHKEAMTERD